MKKRKKQLNTNVFFGFLTCVSLLLFCMGFLFDKGGRLLFLGLSYLVGTVILLLHFRECKRTGCPRYNALFYILASLLVFVCVDPYQALLLLLIYLVGITLREFTGHSKIRVRDAIAVILQTNYHLYENGKRSYIQARDILVQDTVELLSGEMVPVDGVVLMGEATATLKSIDGSSKQIALHSGDTVIAGTTVLSGNLIVRARTTFADSTVSRMVQDQAQLSAGTTAHEKGINRLVNRISVLVFTVGLVLSVLKGVFTNQAQAVGTAFIWLSFLMCADGFRMLLHCAYVVASMRCINNGVSAKNKKLIEKSIFIKNLLFRKQGVLTERRAVISKIVPIEGVKEEELATFAAYAQYKASHPMTDALNAYCGKTIREEQIACFMETEDNGAMVQLRNGLEIITGTSKILAAYGVISGIISEEAVLCVAVNNRFIGHIVFEYPIKADIHQYVQSLKYAGAKNLSIVTKDSERATKAIALKSGIKRYYSELDHAGIEKTVQEFGKNTVYVGYGKGDAYTFGDECVKLMYGGFQFDNDTTDGILLSDGLGCILKFFNIIKETRWLIFQNLIINCVPVLLLLYLCLHGTTAFWVGGAAIWAAAVLCDLNCLRVLRKI